MTPSTQLTRLGRLRRFHQMARKALSAFDMADADLKFLTYNGNVIYRVDTPARAKSQKGKSPFVDGRYVLRIHMDYHSIAAIRSELQWLTALRRDIDLAVPEPIKTVDSELVGEVTSSDGEIHRKFSLLKWLDGRFVAKRFNRDHAVAWGKLMARMHQHAQSWKLPNGFERRRRDWDGLFRQTAGFEAPAEGLWDAVPDNYREPFEEVTSRIKAVMDKLGTGADAFGLVHADLDVFTNVLFSGGDARVIDFDDCCFAYRLHDLAFALCPWQGKEGEEWVQEAFLDGYAGVRSIPQEQLAELELFKAAFNANLMLWMLDWMKLSPQSDQPMEFVNKYGRNMLRCFETS